MSSGLLSLFLQYSLLVKSKGDFFFEIPLPLFKAFNTLLKCHLQRYIMDDSLFLKLADFKSQFTDIKTTLETIRRSL